jgi:CBS domain-containing protein
MTKAPLTVEESCGVAEAVERMSARNVRRAPVVSSSGDLVGIVTFDDLLPVVAEDLSTLAKLIGTQARLERDAPS